MKTTVLKFLLHLILATIIPMLLAPIVLFVSALVTDFLRLGVSAQDYQRLLGTPPFLLHLSIAFVLGFLMTKKIGADNVARWVWVVHVVWLIIGIATWQQLSVASDISVWQWFFSGKWWTLPASPARARWVGDQFTHTLPLLTALSYALAGLARGDEPVEARSAEVDVVR